MMPARSLACVLTVVLPLLLASPAGAAWDDWRKKIEETASSVLNGDQEAETDAAFDGDTLARALRDALEVGTERAVEQVSRTDGYLGNPRIRIPLPSPLDKAAETVRQFGGDTLVDNLERSINRAAERAAPEARAYFLDALQTMDLEDARRIYQGPDNAATRYFEDKTRGQLQDAFKPVISDAINEQGVLSYYQALVKKASDYPLISQLNLNLNMEDYVTGEALDGLFQVLAEEERRIREDPAARTTEILRDVFGR